MRRSLLATIALVFGTFFAAGACGGTDACEDNKCSSPDVTADAGAADARGVVGPPVDCLPEVDPVDAPACVVNDYGVFVSPTGSATGAGTKEDPVNSINAAQAKLENKPRIYVCDGEYKESVKITLSVDIFGGFTCGWTKSQQLPRFTAPAEEQLALDVSDVSGLVTLRRLSFAAVPATTKGKSSIAARAQNAGNLSLVDVTLTAGDAADGTDGATGVEGKHVDGAGGAIQPKGNAASNAANGPERACSCTTGGTTTGGRGGAGNADQTMGISGVAGSPAISGSPGGARGNGATSCSVPEVNGTGDDGANAAPAVATVKLASPGEVVSGTWKSANGPKGANGNPGQGGGGGGGNNGGGGSGGCGGCGGGGGGGGGGAGSSIAFLSLASTVQMTNCKLATSNGGKGGSGGAGYAGSGAAGDGIKGGGGGAGGVAGATDGCAGGGGGAGSAGAPGGGGAGGLSAAILHTGKAPVLDGATSGATLIKQGGAGGAGGAAGLEGPNGVTGAVVDVASLPK